MGYRTQERRFRNTLKKLLINFETLPPDEYYLGAFFYMPDLSRSSVMTDFEFYDPDYPDLLKENFNSQPTMQFIGAVMSEVRPGYCELQLPWRHEFTQQSDAIHGGIITTLADNAGGYAAWTLEPNDANVLAVEFKVNFFAAAKGDPIIARGQVLKRGTSLTISRVDIYSMEDGEEIHCAAMQQTLMVIRK